MLELQIVDKSFELDAGAVAGVVPKYIKWKRDLLDQSKPVFFCNESLNDLTYNNWPGEIYGLLFESPAILPKTFDLVPTYIDKLKYLFTPNTDLIRAYPEKARYIPGGGVWNSVVTNSNENTFPTKQFLVSMLSSSKMMCGLHQFRLNVANMLKQNEELSPHVYIQNPGEYINPSETLNKYCYSVIIENHISDNYFTEKILNCFATGVIPIYFGAKNIDYFFDGSAIFKFQSLDSLAKLLRTLSFEGWERRIPVLKENMRLAKTKYRCIEDYMFMNYENLLIA
jgi:hypothetical protein